MIKKFILAVIAVFICWSVVDFIIHGMILAKAYENTAELWRPMMEMKMGLMRIVVLISSLIFVAIYTQLISKKNVQIALLYGFLFGIGAGISMGYGTYAVMPIPYYMAFTWFFGSLIEGVLAGLITGLIIHE